MIKAYFDYREPGVTIHRNPNCTQAKVGPGQDVRHVMLNADFLSKELGRFGDGRHRFDEKPGTSDLWLIVDFQDLEFEEALVRHVKRVLGRRYRPLEEGELRAHGC